MIDNFTLCPIQPDAARINVLMVFCVINEFSVCQILHLAHKAVNLLSNFVVRPVFPMSGPINASNSYTFIYFCQQLLIISVCDWKIVNIVFFKYMLRMILTLQKTMITKKLSKSLFRACLEKRLTIRKANAAITHIPSEIRINVCTLVDLNLSTGSAPYMEITTSWSTISQIRSPVGPNNYTFQETIDERSLNLGISQMPSKFGISLVFCAAVLFAVDGADYGRFQYGSISWKSLTNDSSIPTSVQIVVERYLVIIIMVFCIRISLIYE